MSKHVESTELSRRAMREEARVIRVVHVVDSLHTGGMEKGVCTVAGRSSSGFEHAVVCMTTSGPMAGLLRPGTRVVEMRKPGGNSLRFVRQLARVLADLRPDVVHTRNWGALDGVLAARLARLRGVVHGEHGWTMADPDGRSRKRRLIRRFLSRWIREFTCVSQDIADWLSRDVRIRRPITQIRNGVDTDLYRPGPERDEVRAELGIGGGDFVAGVVGRLDPIKDHTTLFRAFARLPAEGPPAHLLVVGEGAEADRLAREAPPRARLLGLRKDIPRLLRALDLFVLPSRNEGISNTILEAMASGVPVLASRVGGNVELVEDGSTGTLFPAGDVDALLGQLVRYRSDPGLRGKEARVARARVLERHSLQAMVSGYETVWRRVAGSLR